MKDSQVRELAVTLLTQETARDKQRKVGASQISDPCTYHLARALITAGDAPMKYWLGGKIGTAVHMLLEDAVEKADTKAIPEVEGAIVEQKIYLGELEDYGTISSKPDLVLPASKHLIDWKTSSRDKMRKMQKYIDDPENGKSDVAYTLQKYVAQVQLYAWGLNRAGTEVESCSLVFINRDGTTENDIWTYTFEYSEELAVQLWDRLVNLWTAIKSGVDLEQLDRNEHCFKCAIGI